MHVHVGRITITWSYFWRSCTIRNGGSIRLSRDSIELYEPRKIRANFVDFASDYDRLRVRAHALRVVSRGRFKMTDYTVRAMNLCSFDRRNATDTVDLSFISIIDSLRAATDYQRQPIERSSFRRRQRRTSIYSDNRSFALILFLWFDCWYRLRDGVSRNNMAATRRHGNLSKTFDRNKDFRNFSMNQSTLQSF